MRKGLLGIILLILGVLGAYAFNPERYTVDVGDFNELQVVDPINVVYRCNPDSAGMAVFTCPSNVVQSIIFSNKKNKLRIERNMDVDTPVNELPAITVYSNYIQSVENTGDSTVYVCSPAPGALFKAKVIGNGRIVATDIHATQTEGTLDTGKGTIVLEGVTRVAKFKNVGKGTIDASDLKSESCSVKILGLGPVKCQVSNELEVMGMGSGKIYVTGNPKVKKRAIGSIEIIKTE